MSFQDISLVIVAAGIFGLIAKFFKQPLLVGYLFAGIILTTLGVLKDSESFNALSQIGVTLLLFLMGMQINIREILGIGKIAVVAGLGQVIITTVLGFLISRILGFSTSSSVYISVALTFSSTIIMVKLLSDKKDLGSLYGQLAVGILLVQDLVAILILMFLSGVSQGKVTFIDYAFIIIKALALFLGVWYLSKKVIPSFFEKAFAQNAELLFIGSLAWAFGFTSFISGPLNFSMEIGGFLAGLSLSGLPEHLQIVSKTKPLRDFFLTIFFFALGSQLLIGPNLTTILPIAVIFSAFVLFGNPLIIMSILGYLGYKKRTSFLTGLTVAQISEFSFILMAMGKSIGHLNETDVSVVILVGVITMTLSTHIYINADNIYSKLSKYLNIFERNIVKEKAYLTNTDMENHIVLVGCDRTGSSILPFLRSKNFTFVVVDFNPQVFRWLSSENIPIIFGDINDEDIQEAANIKKARMVISTVSDYSDNIHLLESLSSESDIITLFTATERREAVKLYERGATFVIVPEIVAGDYIKNLLRLRRNNNENWIKLGKNHFNRLIST